MAEGKVPNEALLAAALTLMKDTGRPLKKVSTRGRAMLYEMPDRTTVRVRTCNDHILVTLAESAEEGAALNIEGTDFLLIVMPRAPRTPGPVDAYLVPTSTAVEAVRQTHREWLASNPNTRGQNRTWNIWFDDSGPARANGYARRWQRFLLPGGATTEQASRFQGGGRNNELKLGDVIADARQRIARTAGVPLEAVKISVDLTG